MVNDKENLLSASFRLPAALVQKMNEQIIADGYGMRGKGKWIKESLESFLKLPDYPELTNLADEAVRPNKTVSIRLSRDLMFRVEKAIVKVRKEYPSLEGVKSKIIRTSIYQRLIRGINS